VVDTIIDYGRVAVAVAVAMSWFLLNMKGFGALSFEFEFPRAFRELRSHSYRTDMIASVG
jgi:hypothetical protein